MQSRITTLVEDNADEAERLRNEHGISFFIEHGEARVLFDTGQSANFLDNAADLGVDVATADHVVLSHGHYDHTDGFPFLIDRLGAPRALHVHRDIFHRKIVRDQKGERYAGASFDREWLDERSVPIHEVSGNGAEIAPGVHVVTRFDETHPLEVDNPRFIVERPGGPEDEIDDFRDEISLVLERDDGIVVVVGCSHPGIMNMVSTIRERFDRPVLALLGGTHLIEAHGDRLDGAVSYLTDGTCGRLGLSHCTGEEAMGRLADRSDTFFRNVTGTVFEW